MISAEPSLGAPERHPRSWNVDTLSGLQMPRSGFLYVVSEKSQEHWADGAPGDHEREVDDDRERDDAEYEGPGFIAGGNEDGR